MSSIAEQTEALHKLPLGALEQRCARETQRFYRRETHDPRFCFELFRRAAAGEDQLAWEIVYKQYHAQVHGWILRHPAFEETGAEAQDFQNEAFERLWKALAAEKFERFADLASILQFLRMCVHSAIVDYVRKKRLIEVSLESELEERKAPAVESGPDEAVEADAQRVEMWNYVRSCLKGDQEYIVVYENYVLDLKSREKYERHPNLFQDVEDVYRTKQNLLARFRRDPNLQKYLGIDA